jgi:hypothetical protein
METLFQPSINDQKPQTASSSGEYETQLELLSKGLPGFEVAEALNRVGGNTVLYKELLACFKGDIRKLGGPPPEPHFSEG